MNFARKLCSFVLLGLAVLGVQAGTAPFDQAAFDKAVAGGGPVVVQFHADWCPTCKEQAPIVQQVLADPKMKEVQLYVADFDKEKALKKQLRVSHQSTFVVFKGGKEVGRSTGQPTKPAIEGTFGTPL